MIRLFYVSFAQSPIKETPMLLTVATPYVCTGGHYVSALLIAGQRWSATASEDHYTTIVVLMRNGADLRQRDAKGHTILHWAATRGHKMLMRLALSTAEIALEPVEVTKIVNHQDEVGYSLLMHAVMSLQEDVVLKLLQLGVDANLVCHEV